MRKGFFLFICTFRSFNEAHLLPEILDNVVKARYSRMTPVQAYAMPLIFDGRDVMGCAPTGCGKTVIFAFLERGGGLY